jgi:hypothetical protein
MPVDERNTSEACFNILIRKQYMKTNKSAARSLSLGDLILAVSSCSESQEETVAAVSYLLASGKVRLMNQGATVKARVL